MEFQGTAQRNFSRQKLCPWACAGGRRWVQITHLWVRCNHELAGEDRNLAADLMLNIGKFASGFTNYGIVQPLVTWSRSGRWQPVARAPVQPAPVQPVAPVRPLVTGKRVTGLSQEGIRRRLRQLDKACIRPTVSWCTAMPSHSMPRYA